MSPLNQVMDILRLAPHNRKNSDVLKLMDLTANIEFFKKVSEEEKTKEVHMSCCQVMGLEEFPADAAIFKYGDIGDSFYIILKGSVAVQIPTKKIIKRPIQPIVEEQKESHKDSNVESRLNGGRRSTLGGKNLVQQISTINQQKPKLDQSEKSNNASRDRLEEIPESPDDTDEVIYEEIEVIEFIEVAKLHAGASFGELALMNDKPRAATIKCSAYTICAVLKKNDFKNILGGISEKKLNLKIKYFQSLPFFTNWTKVALSKFSYYFELKYFKPKQVIYKEGDPLHFVYFVKEGEFKMTKKLNIDIASQLETQSFTEGIKQDSSKFRLRNKPFTKKVDMQLVIKGKNEVFGHEELLEGHERRQLTCECISYAEVYAISKEDFQQRIPYPETWKVIRDKYSLNSKRRDFRLNELEKVEHVKQDIAFSSLSPIKKNPNNKLPSLESSKESSPILKKTSNSSKVTLVYRCKRVDLKRMQLSHLESASPSPIDSSKRPVPQIRSAAYSGYSYTRLKIGSDVQKPRFTRSALNSKPAARETSPSRNKRRPPPNFFAIPKGKNLTRKNNYVGSSPTRKIQDQSDNMIREGFYSGHSHTFSG
jgi:CRP-like cAMP-binding protein